MKNYYSLLFALLLLPWSVGAQSLSAPVAQGVFGGTVNDIDVWQKTADTVVVFLASESPNSLFYGYAYRGSAGYTQDSLRPVPSADADNGYGATVGEVRVHQNTGLVFFLHQSTLYRTSETATAATPVDSLVKTTLIQNDTLFVVKNGMMPGSNDTLVWYYVDGSGALNPIGGISLLKNYFDPPQLLLNPQNKRLYIYDRGTMPHLYAIYDPYYALTTSTVLTSAVNPAPAAASYPLIQWRTFGFADDGTWYVAGNNNAGAPPSTQRMMAWSSDAGVSWTVVPMNAPGPPGGALAGKMTVDYSGSNRHIIIGSLTTKDDGMTWQNPGFGYIEKFNRANDGAIAVDPLDSDLKYHATNVGFGFSRDTAASMYDWNAGFEAVQVNDIDMTTSFATGWVASKSGIRKVTGFKSGAPVWSDTQFPMGDGSPYFSVGIDPADSNTVFVGNLRIYRTIDDGWTWSQVFDPGNAPLNFSRFGTQASAVKVCPWNSDLVIATFRNDFGEHDGGTFASNDGGNSWMQVLLDATSPGFDVNCNDVVFALEGSDTVAYVATEPKLTTMGPPSGVGMYKLTLSSGMWTSAVEGSFGATDYNTDLEIVGDSLYVLNRDPGLLPVHNLAIKDLTTGTWSSRMGPNASGTGTAITVGDGFAFMALDHSIYTYDLSNPSAGWTLGYAYPNGMEINVLFYDELLAGTGTGLYAHDLAADIGIPDCPEPADRWILFPNPFSTELQLSKPLSVRVTNLQGQFIYESTEPVRSIETSHWATGVYFIQTELGTQRAIKF